ncbi:MAG: UbiA family prenyltransferase [candidate division WOR-3 bacterium]
MASVRGFIERLETQRYGLGAGFLTFTGIAVLRAVLEGALENARLLTVQSSEWQSLLFIFVHLYMFFAASYLGITVFLSVFSKERPERVARAVLSFFWIILLPPLIDALFFGGGMKLTYLPEVGEVWETALAYFNPASSIRITPGMRVETGLVLLGSITYIAIKRRNIFWAMLGAIVIYAYMLFILGSFPAFIAWAWHTDFKAIFKTGGFLLLDTQKYGLVNLFIATVMAGVIAGVWKPQFLRALFTQTRPKKIPFYLVMALVGFGVGNTMLGYAYPNLWKNPFDWLAAFGMLLAVLLAYWSATLMNDAIDLPLDTENKKRTSITSGALTEKEAKALSAALGLMGGFWAITLGWPSFLLYSVMLFLGFAYSAPPLRLKSIPIISTFTLASCSLFACYLGFSLFAKEKAITAFPGELVGAFLLGITLSFTLKDKTDIEGDRKGNIRTLFVIFGPKSGSWITSILAALSFIAMPLVLGVPVALSVAVPAAALLFLLGMRKRYSEGLMWLLTLVYAVGVGWFYYPRLKVRSPSGEMLSFGELMQAEQYYRQNKYELSLNHYARAIDGSDDPMDYTRAAKSAGEMRNFELAEALHKRCLERFPTYTQGHILYMRLLFSLGKPDEMLSVAKRALELGCYSSELVKFIGLARLSRGETDKALSAFLVSAQGGSHEGLFLAYLTARHMGKPSLHLRDRAMRLRADPDESFPYFAYWLYKRGEIEKAKSVNQELLSLNPTSEIGLAFQKIIR